METGEIPGGGGGSGTNSGLSEFDSMVLLGGAIPDGPGLVDRLPSTLKPGPHAGESIPVKPGRPTPAQQTEINRIGRDTGCHTCGAKDPGTKSGNHVLDHQPPSALKPPGAEQRGYPHCIDCMRRQGGEVLQELRRQQP